MMGILELFQFFPTYKDAFATWTKSSRPSFGMWVPR
jgi:hypothetical protein